MLCPACTTSDRTDILTWYKNKNINRCCVPFVPRVPRFSTPHTPENNRSNDDRSKENLIDYLGVIENSYLLAPPEFVLKVRAIFVLQMSNFP
jgi:hypothetical protein